MWKFELKLALVSLGDPRLAYVHSKSGTQGARYKGCLYYLYMCEDVLKFLTCVGLNYQSFSIEYWLFQNCIVLSWCWLHYLFCCPRWLVNSLLLWLLNARYSECFLPPLIHFTFRGVASTELGWKAQNGCDFTDHCNRCFFILPSLSLSFSHQVCVCLFILMSVCYCLCGILLSLTKTFLLNIDVCA